MSAPAVEFDYIEQAGSGIPDLGETPAPPEAAPPAPAAPAGELEPSLYPGWSEEAIEAFLKGAGSGIHMLIGQAEQDWLMTERDLERIAPPLTRICNRWEPALKLSPYADPLLVAHGMGLYGWRSALERQRALRDRAAAGPGYEFGDELEEEEIDFEVAEVDLEDAGAGEPPSPNGRPPAGGAGGIYFADAPIHNRRARRSRR